MAIFSTEPSVNAYSSLTPEQNTFKMKGDPALIPASGALLTAFKNLITEINTSMPQKLEEVPFATMCGFKIVNNQVVFDQTQVNYAKATYYSCFRVPFTEDGDPEKFETLYSLANKVRLEAWRSNIPGIKRLAKNGENEVYTSSTLPTNETTPAIVSDEYKTKAKYADFNEVVHRLLENDLFNATTGATQVPLYVWLLSAPETPYRTQWLERMKSIPFFPQAKPPAPVAGTFTKVTITPDKTLNIINNGFHFNRTTKVTQVQSDGKLKLEGFQETKVYVSIYDSSSPPQLKFQSTPKDFENATGDGTYYLNGNSNLKIHVENNPNSSYIPDLKNKSFFKERKVLVEGNRNYVMILEKGLTATADVTPPAGITKQDLVNWPVTKETVGTTTTYYIAYPKHPTSATALTEGAALDDFAKSSGLTFGVGIDSGAGLKSTSTAFLDTYLTATAAAWAQYSQADKQKVYGILGQRGKAASDVWVRNRPLFDALDQETATKNYSHVLLATMPFINDSYLTPSVNAFTGQASSANKLRTQLNVIEKYVVATLTWNSPGSVWARAAAFSRAINQHNYNLLLDVVKEMVASGKNNNAPHVKEVLEGTRMVNYYKSNHYLD